MALTKVCGLKTQDAAIEGIKSGADMLGMIMVPGRSRTVNHETAKRITALAKQSRIDKKRKLDTAHKLIIELENLTTGVNNEEYQAIASKLIIENGPFTVGVFRNQQLDEVFKTAESLELDFIQLHGDENKVDFLKVNRTRGLKYGIIPRFVVPRDVSLMTEVFNQRDGVLAALLDSEAGGEGKKIDWGAVANLPSGKYILAGGLTPENVLEGLNVKNVIGVDVSGGIETNGEKDAAKMRKFILQAKSV